MPPGRLPPVMPYDDGLAHRVRETLDGRVDAEELRMFGGLGFTVDGNMCVGVIEDSLVARVGPEAHEDALAEPHARPFDFTGREMAGWVFVDHPGLAEDASLEAWIDRSLAFVETLPPK